MNNLTVSKNLFREDEFTTGVELGLDGELLYEDAQDFMKEITEMAKGCGKKVVLDLGRLRYIDSSGLGAILYISESLRMQGQKLFVTKANKNNLRVLKTINKVGTFVLEETAGSDSV